MCVCVCMCQTDSPQEASHNNAVLVSSGPQLMKRTPPVTWHPGRSTVAHSYFPQTYVQCIGSKTDISDRKGDRNRKHAVVKLLEKKGRYGQLNAHRFLKKAEILKIIHVIK